MPETPIPPIKPLWTIKDVAEYLCCTVRHVQNLQRGGLPYMQVGRLVRFDPEEVRNYLRGNRRLEATQYRGRIRKRARMG